MKTLETTPLKTKELKSYYVCAHNLNSAKYSLNLCSKYSNSPGCGAQTAYKFDSLDEAIKCGDGFLNSNFKGLFAHKDFMNQWR